MLNRPTVLEADVEDALAGQKKFLPDASGSLWLLWRRGDTLTLTKVADAAIIPIEASQVEREVSQGS